MVSPRRSHFTLVKRLKPPPVEAWPQAISLPVSRLVRRLNLRGNLIGQLKNVPS